MKTILTLLLSLSMLQAQTYKVLHYTETTGYDHNTRNESLAMFQSWELLLNYEVTQDNTGDQFTNLDTLLQYDVVVFSNTSGNSGLSSIQRSNFEAYIDSGGSYLGIHAASDTYRHSSANGSKTGTWDWYAETVAGASVQNSPNHTSASKVATMTQSLSHPILINTPSPWTKEEEYYYWENGYLDTSFTELLRVGQTGSNSYDAPRMMAQCRNLPGGGRAFYTALGHKRSNYESDGQFQTLIYEALKWLLPAQLAVPVNLLAVNVQGSNICWQASKANEVLVEILLPGTMDWQFSVRYHDQVGCYELRGCDRMAVRIKAVGEDQTEVVSDAKEVEPKPFHRLEYGVFNVDCSVGDRYSVTDSSGRTMMTGIVSGSGIDLQGLSPGFYTIKVADNVYSIIR